MKRLFLTLCITVASLFAAAQNGGQHNENGAVRLDYIGLVNGSYKALITNKLNKQAIIKVDYKNQFTDHTLAANSSVYYDLGAQPTSFLLRAKSLMCGGSDCGWVELCLTGLPVTFKNVSFELATNTLKFEVVDVFNVSHFNIQLSVDGGKTYKNIALVFPDPLQPNTTYSVKLDLKTKK